MKKRRFIFVSFCFLLIASILFSGCFRSPKRSVERKAREAVKKEAKEEVKEETSVKVETQEAKRKEVDISSFPSELLYPNAKIENRVKNKTLHGEVQQIVSFTVDSLEQVQQYYESKLPTQGWVQPEPKMERKAGGYVYPFTKGKQFAFVIIYTDYGKTRIHVQYEEKNTQ
ncbi:MAG: hypothetical protein QME54_03740 [Actinomycetota bacterium]|nr:hypothetical protein [Actinomycetota bacterium]